jgi:hypothetical protein
MKSLVAICLAILIINVQFLAIHLNASVISPLSITTLHHQNYPQLNHNYA